MAKYQAGELEDDEDIIDVEVIPFYRGLLGPGQPDEETPDAPDEETPETPGEELPPVPDEEGKKKSPENPKRQDTSLLDLIKMVSSHIKALQIKKWKKFFKTLRLLVLLEVKTYLNTE